MNNNNQPVSKAPRVDDFGEFSRQLASADAQGRSHLTTNEICRLLGYLEDAGDVTRPVVEEFGATLSVAIRLTREFGMVISAGIGGTDAQLYADAIRPARAGVSAATALTDAQAFLELFRDTVCYRKLAGAPAGGGRLVSDVDLLGCIATFISIANHYSPERPDVDWVIEELEINPLVIRQQQIVPLDARCTFTRPVPAPAPRPIGKIDKLLHPQSIGIIGVSASKMNFGRIMLNNIVGSGYDKSRLRIIRPGDDEIDGVKCVESLEALDGKLDLFVVAVAADAVYDLVDEIISTDAVETVMLIPGGLGETRKSREPTAVMRGKMNAAHLNPGGGPVFLGGNCLGVISRPGNYDSWFVPAERLPRPQIKQQRNSALISQSGAFMVTRMSKHPWLDPAYLIADGNQSDLTHSDLLRYFNTRDEIDVIGFYIEGFRDLDGLAFARAVREAVVRGKQIVIYKAGSTEAGSRATMGHTASTAGDYRLCENLLRQAGALVAEDFSEFTDLMYIADCLHNKAISGNRLGTISGAGFEAVGMADSIEIEDFSMVMPALAPATVQRVEEILVNKRLDSLIEVRNPIDINPAADDEVHLQVTVAFAEDPNLDAVVSGLDPVSPVVMGLEESRREGFNIYNEASQVQTFPKFIHDTDKPVVCVADGGPLYDAMAATLMNQGVCVFRSCERAVHALVRYVDSRLRAEVIRSRYGSG